MIGTVNGDMQVECPVYELEVQGVGERSQTKFTTQFARLNISVLSAVPNVHPEIAKENYRHLQDIKFSDTSSKGVLPIHAILGVKDYAHIKMGNIRKGNEGDPIAEETALGWTLMGHIGEAKEQKTHINLTIDKERTIQEDAKRLLDLDVLGIKDDEEAYAEFKDSIKQNEDGRYCVKLPWKQGNYYLPDNRNLAEQRVKSQLKRMSKQPELLKEYDEIIKQQEENGIIEPVPDKPDGDRIHYVPHHCVVREQAESTKVLGVSWNTVTDNMSVSYSHVLENDHTLTQRGLLKTTASIFDPLGIASPVTIIAKMIYHEVCLAKAGWDTEISSDQVKLWESWIRNLAKHPELEFSRCIIKHPDEPVLDIKLHGFADASLKACAAAIYLQVTQPSETYVQLLTAKSRVSKPGLTVPRLELVAAQMLTKMMKQVQEALEDIKISEVHAWSDSKTVLCWLKNHGEWKQFVRLRVDQILQESNIKWHYVNTKDNPADIASRGMHIQQLTSNQLWWNGPPWINDQDSWPHLPEIEATEESEVEVRHKSTTAATVEVKPEGLEAVIDLQRYNSQHKVIRITAWIYRFINNARKKRNNRVHSSLSTEEIRAAESRWMQHVQAKIKQHESFQQLTQQLNLKEENGILRCHGRLEHAEIETKPVLLPRNHAFTELAIKDAHRRVLHFGVSITLAELRQRYWVPKGRQAVKKIIRECQHCANLSAKPLAAAATASLPECRVKPGHAFETVGVDFAGPFYCSNGKKTTKAYITLFTCATSRAVHIEPVQDMSATTFKQSLKSLITRRGMPSKMISDNAQTFKSTAKWLKKLKKNAAVNDFLQAKGIDWQFNVARAPWWGGFFERLIGLVKSCLIKILGRAKISFKEFKESLLDVEAVLNNRPLTYLDEELGPEALTPNHLIHGRRIPTLAWEQPDSNDEAEATNRLKHLQKQLEHFWKRWNREYIASLREHHRWNAKKPQKSLKKGAIVLIQQEGMSRSRWKLGRVDRLIEGKDGVVRGAVLKVVTNDRVYTVERPLQKLCLLELYAEEEEEETVERTLHDRNELLRRSARDAAAAAKVRIADIDEDITENQDSV